MCKDSTDLDIKIHKLFCLSRKTDNKARPLLVALESEVEKLELLSRAPKFRFHEEYKNIFVTGSTKTVLIAQDRKFDCFTQTQGLMNTLSSFTATVYQSKVVCFCWLLF